MNTNITKRIHINPQSKGSLGKSFEAEFRTVWLDYHSIQWNGSDLDDRHHSFADRHPEQVQPYKLGSDDESKSTLLGLFRNVPRSDAPVHVIDLPDFSGQSGPGHWTAGRRCVNSLRQQTRGHRPGSSFPDRTSRRNRD